MNSSDVIGGWDRRASVPDDNAPGRLALRGSIQLRLHVFNSP